MGEARGALRRVVVGWVFLCLLLLLRLSFDVVMLQSELVGDDDLPRRGVDLPRAGASQAHGGNTFELDTDFIGSSIELHRREDE